MKSRQSSIPLIFLLFIIMMPTGCRTQKEPQTQEAMITLQQTPCFGTCPVYKMQLYPSGKVLFEGESFVEKEGAWVLQIPKKEMKQLEKELLEKVNFMDLKNVYDNPGVSDLPSSILQYKKGAQNKKVVARVDFPKPLLQFIIKLDALRKRAGWEQLFKS